MVLTNRIGLGIKTIFEELFDAIVSGLDDLMVAHCSFIFIWEISYLVRHIDYFIVKLKRLVDGGGFNSRLPRQHLMSGQDCLEYIYL